MIINKGKGQVVRAPRMATVPRGERPANRTSAGLRNALFDEIDALRRGDGDPQRANAVAQLAKAVLMTEKLEYQFKQSEGGNASGEGRTRLLAAAVGPKAA